MSTRRPTDSRPGSPRQIILATCCVWLGICCVTVLRPALNVLDLYRPPQDVQTPAAIARDAQTERVVLVVVNRLSNDALSERLEPWRFVELRRRAAEGARGTLRAVQPSGDAPTWVALLTGAGPEQSGIIGDAERGPLQGTTIFERAKLAQKRSAFVAGPAAGRDRAEFGVPDQVVTARSSAATGQAAVELLRSRSASLVVVLLEAGQLQPGWTQQLAEQIDVQVGAIAATLDPTRDTLIVTGDHGVLPDGSTGGHENALLDVPLVLWGNRVVPDTLSTIDQRDIAPTVDMLLGSPYSSALGRPMLDAFAVDEQIRAGESLAVLRARIAVPSSLLPASAVAEAKVHEEAARSAFEQNDWQRTRAAVDQAFVLLTPPPPSLRYVTSQWTWSAGLPLFLLLIAVAVSRFRHRLAFLLVPLGGLAGYMILWIVLYFVIAGKSISLSTIYGGWQDDLFDIGLWSGLALGVVAVTLTVARFGRKTASPIDETGWAALLVLACLGFIILIYLAVAGLPSGRLPGLAGWAGLLIVLAQMAGVGLAAPLAMALSAMVNEVVSRGR